MYNACYARYLARLLSIERARDTRTRHMHARARIYLGSAQRLNGSSRISRQRISRAASLANRTRYARNRFVRGARCEVARRATILRARVNRERNLTDIPVLRA